MINVFASRKPQQSRNRSLRDNRAFSLVEVVLAIGVFAFALLGIVALVPVGIHSATNSLQESQAVDVLSAVVADRRATPFAYASSNFLIPALNNTMAVAMSNFFGVTDAHQSTNNLSQAHYRIDYIITPPAPGTLNPYLGYFRASWPAIASTNTADSVEIAVTFPNP